MDDSKDQATLVARSVALLAGFEISNFELFRFVIEFVELFLSAQRLSIADCARRRRASTIRTLRLMPMKYVDSERGTPSQKVMCVVGN